MKISTNEGVIINLSEDEALVLFDFARRMTEQHRVRIDDHALRQLFTNIHSELETRMIEPFEPGYDFMLARARTAVCGVTT